MVCFLVSSPEHRATDLCAWLWSATVYDTGFCGRRHAISARSMSGTTAEGLEEVDPVLAMDMHFFVGGSASVCAPVHLSDCVSRPCCSQGTAPSRYVIICAVNMDWCWGARLDALIWHCAGDAMWQPDQLEAESARGCWVAVSPPPALRHPQVGGCRLREQRCTALARSKERSSACAAAD
jgi:hypothetical protein